MENYLGILGSQSRYELQQTVLFNPNGLISNTTNRFGIVDGSNNCSQITSICNSNKNALTQPILSDQPTLSLNGIATDINGLQFSGSDYMDGNMSFYPDWDDVFFISLTFNTSSSDNMVIYSISQDGSGGRASLQINSGQVIAVLSNGSGVTKNKRTLATFNDGSKHTLIWFNAGTDDIADWNIYIDGTEITSFSSTRNDSFVGQTIYPSTINPRHWLGDRLPNSAQAYTGNIGKVIVGNKEPNYLILNSALNAKTF